MAQEIERSANVVLSADVEPYRQQIQAAGRDTAKFSDQVDKLTRSLDKLAKAAGNKLLIFGAGSAAGVAATTYQFAKFEKQMTSLRVNAEVTGRSYETMERNVNKLRRTYGMTTDSAVRLQSTIQGFRDYTAPVEKLTNTFTKMGLATGEAPERLAQGMLQLQRTLGLPQREADKLGNTFTSLAVRSGQSASSIMDFANVISPIGRIAGMSAAEIAGVSTAFTKAGQDGVLAGNAFNKMLTDIMQATQSGSPDLAKYANLIGVTVDQFKQMNKTTAITQIFDEINRMGPDAITVLNRLGLDGMRMQRAIAGVSSQAGGIGGAITQAINSYNSSSDNELNRGAKAGLQGISDDMAKLRETTAQFGETIGSSFEGPVKMMISLLQKLSDVGVGFANNGLVKGIMSIGAMAIPLSLVAGGLLKIAGVLSAGALFRGLTSNFLTQGFSDRQRQVRVGGPLHRSQLSFAGQAIVDRDANWVGRTMYGAGERLGSFVPPLVPGYRSRAAGAALGVGRIGLDMIRSTFSPLVHPRDPSLRDHLFATSNEQARGAGMFSRTMTGGRNWGYNLLPERSRPPLLGGFGANAASFTRSLMGATGAIGGAALGGAGVIGSTLGRGAMALAGGPAGLAFLGGTAAIGAGMWANRENQVSGLGGDNGITLMDEYNAALGKATSSLADFTSALEKANGQLAPRNMGQAKRVLDRDIEMAMSPGRKMVSPGIGDLTERQASMLLNSQIGQGDPSSVQAMKLDLISAFGADSARKILGSNTQFDASDYTSDIFNVKTTKFGLKAGDSTDNQYKYLESELKRQAMEAQKKGGSQAMGLVNRTNFNKVIGSFIEANNEGRVGLAERTQFTDVINKIFLQGKGEHAGFMMEGMPGYDLNLSRVASKGKSGVENGLVEMYRQLTSMDDSGGAGKRMLANMGLTRKQVLKGIEQYEQPGNNTAPGPWGGWFSSSPSFLSTNTSALKGMMESQTATESFEEQIKKTRVGRLIYNNPTIRAATEPGNSANQNVQIQATDELVSTMRKQGMAYSEIERRLIEFQNRVQDVNDPLYQLAQAARQVSGQQLAYQIPFMGTGTRFGVAAAGYVDTERALRPRELAGGGIKADAMAERKKNEEAWQATKQQAQQWLEQQYIAQREFNISQARAVEDYSLSRARAEEDYNLSRRRAEQQFALSRKDAYADFATSRKRAEQDFHHQQELMVKQAAMSMANVYQRVLVQRTWSGSSMLVNSEDQLQRMQDQKANLDKIRSMGLSKTAIQQMGLGEFENEQQLKKLIEDFQNNPKLVAKFNKNMAGRNKAAKALVTDSSNPQWEEMQRSFRVSMERSEQDFKKGMARNKRNFGITMDQAAEDYGRAMDRMAADFGKMQDRAQRDLLRSQKELNWTLEKTLEKSVDHFGGYIDKTVDEMLRALGLVDKALDNWRSKIMKGWNEMPGISQTGSTPLDRNRTGATDSGEGPLGMPTKGKKTPILTTPSEGRVVHNVNINGVNVAANSPDDFVKKMDKEARRKKLAGGTRTNK